MKKIDFGNINELIARYSDLILALLVVSVMTMIIVPLPPQLLDILLSIDIALGIVIILVSLYISDALRIAAFPTILLISTLYRLALNIASTRLILGNGYAGEVIEKFGSALEGRSMLVKRARALPVECVVRGYLTGSGWKDYLETGATSGHKLPPGLRQCEKLRQPLFTPATKAVTGHDQNISFQETVERIGPGVAKKVEKIAMALYEKGRDYAESKGILIADTKFEFGINDAGNVILI